MLIVYAIENKGNGKVYVGQTKVQHVRWNSHKRSLRSGAHHSRHLQNAWNLYGEASFEFYVLGVYETPDEQTAAEAFFITWYRGIGLSYNVYGGNNSVYTRDEETRQKNRQGSLGKQNFLGKHHSDETKQLLSDQRKGDLNPGYGKPLSEETRRKQSEALKGRQLTPMTPEIKAKISATLSGVKRGPYSEEHRQAISDAKKGKPLTWLIGKPLSEEHKEKIRLGNLGREKSEETKRKISEARKGKGLGPRSEETCRKISEATKARYADILTHGTSWAYYKRGCRCELCEAAVHTPKVEKPIVIKHGTRWAYEHHKCRCEPCCEAKRLSR